MTQRICAGIAFVTVVFSAGLLIAQETDKPDESPEDKLIRERFELMLEYVSDFRCRSEDADFPERFESEPIFRYSDPVREYSSSALWRLGSEGRPRAILATECRRRIGGGPGILLEYLALSEAPFSVSSRVQAWSPDASALEFKPVSDAPPPADAPERRLIQMRNIARSFEASETNAGEPYALRLLSSPILRYQETEADRADGAIFLFVFGTNPEAALFIESNGSDWSFAVGRLSAAEEMSLTLDGETAWEAPPAIIGSSQSYNTSHVNTNIPGVKP